MSFQSVFTNRQERVSAFMLCAILLFGFLGVFQSAVFAANVGTSLIVGNASPTVNAVTVNNATSTITLNPGNNSNNGTTTVTINFQVTDSNTCHDVFSSGSLSILFYRSGYTSSTCNSSQNNLRCYKVTTATNNCSGGVSANATATVDVYYFAEATDASSSYSAQNWLATVIATDGSSGSGYLDSAGIEVLTLVAVNVTTSSINYGTVTAGSDTGATNQVATTTNAGNSSTTLQLSAQSTLVFGANAIVTSSQRYSSSTPFTYPGTSTPLTDSAVTVTGFLLTSPTSTTNVAQATFWGVSVSSSYPTGTYTGTTVFGALFQP